MLLRNTRFQALALVAIGALLGYGAAAGHSHLNWFSLAAEPQEPKSAERVSPAPALLAKVEEHNQKAAAHAEKVGKKPNIVFILVDNVGWGDFGVYGGQAPTPRIDALAREGIRFNNYSVECQCTPTRSAIMTGRLPVRSGTVNVLPAPGQTHFGLAPWEFTIAELLSEAGYDTALYGKWHVGHEQGRFPNDQGFDEWWGLPESSDQAGYTSYALFKELGLPAPQIWEGLALLNPLGG